jgi:hypothetical protein
MEKITFETLQQGQGCLVRIDGKHEFNILLQQDGSRVCYPVVYESDGSSEILKSEGKIMDKDSHFSNKDNIFHDREKMKIFITEFHKDIVDGVK